MVIKWIRIYDNFVTSTFKITQAKKTLRWSLIFCFKIGSLIICPKIISTQDEEIKKYVSHGKNIYYIGIIDHKSKFHESHIRRSLFFLYRPERTARKATNIVKNELNVFMLALLQLFPWHIMQISFGTSLHASRKPSTSLTALTHPLTIVPKKWFSILMISLFQHILCYWAKSYSRLLIWNIRTRGVHTMIRIFSGWEATNTRSHFHLNRANRYWSFVG